MHLEAFSTSYVIHPSEDVGKPNLDKGVGDLVRHCVCKHLVLETRRVEFGGNGSCGIRNERLHLCGFVVNICIYFVAGVGGFLEHKCMH